MGDSYGNIYFCMAPSSARNVEVLHEDMEAVNPHLFTAAEMNQVLLINELS